MPALPELQKEFMDGVLHSDTAILKKINTTERLSIYKNNTLLLLTETLMGTFPAVAALGSEGFFRHLARAFIKAYPPKAADLHHYGAEFPDFMQKLSSIEQHPYLADVARLEWLRHSSYFSADATAITPGTLSVLTPENIGRAVFILHPCVRFISSHWPVDKLWKLGHGKIEAADVDIHGSGADVLIFRHGNGIEMWTVPPTAGHFISSLLRREPFESATQQALKKDGGFSPEHHLGQLLQAGLITGIQ